jgi:hypothetical protein
MSYRRIFGLCLCLFQFVLKTLLMLILLDNMDAIISLTLFGFTPHHAVKTSDQENATHDAAMEE